MSSEASLATDFLKPPPTKGPHSQRKSYRDQDVVNANYSQKSQNASSQEQEQLQNFQTFAESTMAAYLARERRKHIINFLLHSVFVISLIFGLICVTLWLIDSSSFGSGPTKMTQESRKSAILSYVGVVLLAGVGLGVVLLKIKYLVVGVLYMLGIIFVLIWAINGSVRVNLSRSEDSLLGEMPYFFRNFFQTTGRIPEFYERLQTTCECCGFDNIDRIRDWPEQLSSPNFPPSCCIKDNACVGIGRMFNYTRVPSGFLIIQSELQLQKWSNAWNKFEGDGSRSRSNPRSGSRSTTEALSNLPVANFIQNFEREVNTDLNLHLAPTPEKTRARNSLQNPTPLLSGYLIPSEIQVKFDTFVEELVYSGKLLRGEWVYFKLPGKLNTRVPNTTTSGLSPFYVSRGLVENILLDPVVWSNRCERAVKSTNKILTTACGALKTDDAQYDSFTGSNLSHYLKWKEMHTQQETKFFFENAIASMLAWDFVLLPIVAALTLFMGIIFWYLYSNIKTKQLVEESPPPDLDLLRSTLFPQENLTQANFHQLPHKLQHSIFLAKLKQLNKTVKNRKTSQHHVHPDPEHN